MEPAEFHRLACDEFGKRVDAIRDDQWELGTPCSEWNVRDLVNHLVNENRWMLPLLEGKTIAEVGDALDGDLLGSDPKGAWAECVKESQDAVARLGGKDDPVHVSWGDISRDDYIEQVAADLTLHAWDLARGIGTDEQLDPKLIDGAHDVVAPYVEVARGAGVYGEKVDVPSNADKQTQVLALIGRQV
jgi:uncharacterized protein (TIGR03086 family)